MTPEQIKRCADGAPPPCEYSEALTFLAQAHLKMVEALKSVLPFIDDAEDVQNLFADSAASAKCRVSVAAVRAILSDLRETS